jgi:hypothetical protein
MEWHESQFLQSIKLNLSSSGFIYVTVSRRQGRNLPKIQKEKREEFIITTGIGKERKRKYKSKKENKFKLNPF